MNLRIAQMILEEATFKHRPDFLTLAPATQIGTHPVQLKVEVLKTDASNVVMVRLEVLSGEGSPQYEFHVRYLVIYEIDGADIATIGDRLAVTGGMMLLPFARETIASLTSRGRFGPTWISPTSFADALNRVTSKPGGAAPAKARRKVAKKRSKKT